MIVVRTQDLAQTGEAVAPEMAAARTCALNASRVDAVDAVERAQGGREGLDHGGSGRDSASGRAVVVESGARPRRSSEERASRGRGVETVARDAARGPCQTPYGGSRRREEPPTRERRALQAERRWNVAGARGGRGSRSDVEPPRERCENVPGRTRSSTDRSRRGRDAHAVTPGTSSSGRRTRRRREGKGRAQHVLSVIAPLPYVAWLPPIENLVDDLERSYTEVQERMTDPSVYNDRREAAEVGRRLKELERAYQLAQEWRAGARRPRGSATTPSCRSSSPSRSSGSPSSRRS